ncbi:MAG: hypothetical protein KF745_06755 [Phycisphaeraceae bacterium]|nr:hypothetical protein [Phycisphaeraceae bacterium]
MPRVLVVAVLLGVGCSKPLLSPDDTRTPFDHYDAVRNEYAKQYKTDAFGRQSPNLEGRLAPR